MTERCRGTLKFVGAPPCERRATVDGFCKTHHPDAVRAKAIAKRDAHQAALNKAYSEADTRRRNARLAALFHENETEETAAKIVAIGRAVVAREET